VLLDCKRKRTRMELGENQQTVFCRIVARNLLCSECCLGIQWRDCTVARRDPFVRSIFVRFVSARLQSDLTSTESIRLGCRHGHRTEARYLLSCTRIALVCSVGTPFGADSFPEVDEHCGLSRTARFAAWCKNEA